MAAGFGYSLGLGPLPVKRVTMKAERREQRGRGRPRPPAPTVRDSEDIAVTRACTSSWRSRLRANRRSAFRPCRCSGPRARHVTAKRTRATLLWPRPATPTSLRPSAATGPHRPPYCQGHSGLRGERHRCTREPSRRAQKQGFAGRGVSAPGCSADEAELAGIAYESSQAERRAEEAERELMEWKKVKFMQDAWATTSMP